MDLSSSQDDAIKSADSGFEEDEATLALFLTCLGYF